MSIKIKIILLDTHTIHDHTHTKLDPLVKRKKERKGCFGVKKTKKNTFNFHLMWQSNFLFSSPIQFLKCVVYGATSTRCA